MGQFTYLVGCDTGGTTVNKLVTVLHKSALLAKAESTFGLSSETCAVEYYDKEYDAYIRPDAPEDIPDGCKVRLVPLPVLLDTSNASNASTSSTVPILAIQPTIADFFHQQPRHIAVVGESPTKYRAIW